MIPFRDSNNNNDQKSDMLSIQQRGHLSGEVKNTTAYTPNVFSRVILLLLLPRLFTHH